MFFETADGYTRKTYGITFAERLALIPVRAIVSVIRASYGKSCMDAWETMKELAEEKDWDAHQCALACYLAFGNWEDVWYYVGCFKH